MFRKGDVADKDNLTIKIKNTRNIMKRSTSRDSPPRRGKRSRSSLGRYDDSSDERITPERIRRRSSRGRSPPSPRGRYSAHREDYGRSREIPDKSYGSYKVLCVSALHPKASDELIKDTLYRDYKRFGDISIRISHDSEDERVAYVCFRNSEDARDAKHSKPRILIYDKVAIVEPVFESRPSRVTSDPYRRPRSRSLTPEYDRYYRSRSPGAIPDQYHAVVERYERPSYGPPPGPPAHHEFRREVPPPPPHHEFIRVPIHREHPYVPRHPPPHLPPGPPNPHAIYVTPRVFPHPHVPRPRPPHFPADAFHFENKKDKFPNYLHHIAPEDDPLATRTLFAGNLEINISEEELRRIFERYGIVEDIDIKRPPPGTGNAFAFVRFQNLDMAHRSKVELSGQYIGKFQCKIGYGKATPTTRIWVGGLGPWTSLSQLEHEFDRFGAIKKIDYIKGDTSAYIQYDSIDAAQAAVKEMRGFALGGPEHKLRVDFADVPGMPTFKPRPQFPPTATTPAEGGEAFRTHAPGTSDEYAYEGTSYEHWPAEGDYAYPSPAVRGYRGRGRGAYVFPDRRAVGYRPAGFPGEHYAHEGEWAGRRDLEYEKHRRSMSGEPGGDRRSRSRSPRMRSIDSDSGSEGHRNGLLSSARTLPDLARRCTAQWQGALILKNSLFPAKFHLTDGDTDIIDSLMKDEEGKHLLRITQRLRLDQPKLDDVSKRISSSTSHAIFLGLAGSSSNITIDDASVQTRPLRNLVSYLKQKEAAGVISLLNKDSDCTGVLYAFPPCSFSTDLLKRSAPSLTEEGLKEDHLVIVVVRGGTA